jgi:hypothetical protein
MDKMYIASVSQGQYSDYSEVVLFVTANQKLASDFCDRANAQIKEALKIPEPTYDRNPFDIDEFRKQRLEWENKRKTVAPDCGDWAISNSYDDPCWFWGEVEVRN